MTANRDEENYERACDKTGKARGKQFICRHRMITLLAATAFFVVPHIEAGALDTLQGITPPTLKPTLPSVQTPAVKVTSAGIIKKQGVTSYMYGTHVLVNENGRTLYALKSDRINLDPYVGRKVTVYGELMKGYPVENGPNYLNVGSLRDQGSGPP
jgi:hypothetical protein